MWYLGYFTERCGTHVHVLLIFQIDEKKTNVGEGLQFAYEVPKGLREEEETEEDVQVYPTVDSRLTILYFAYLSAVFMFMVYECRLLWLALAPSYLFFF